MLKDQCFYNIDLEKYVIAGVLKNPDLFFDLSVFISENDFSKSINKYCWSTFKQIVNNKELLDFRLVAFKIGQAQVKFDDDMSIMDYLESISFISLRDEAVIKYAKELKILTVRRNIAEAGNNVTQAMREGNGLNYTELVNRADQIFYDKVNVFENGADSPKPLFANLQEFIEEIGNEPKDYSGVINPFPIQRDLFGDFTKGDLYFYIARAKAGKALHEDELIPTPTGWSKIKDLKPGDEVFAVDGSITKVMATKFWKNRRIYKVVSSEGFSVLADENHEWYAKKGSDQSFQCFTSKELSNDSFKLPHANFLQLPKIALPTDPYVLGNSAFYEKNIPSIYLRSATDQRQQLLKGLLSSGNASTKENIIEFSTDSKNLADQIGELLLSLNIKPFLSSSLGRHFIKFSLDTTTDRHIFAEYHGVGNTVCIEIEHPSHLFLCGKGMLPTHNSSILMNMLYKMLISCDKQRVRSLVVDTELNEEDLKFRLMSMMSGINEWYLRTGQWRRDVGMVNKVRSVWPLVKNMLSDIDHIYVGGKNMDEIVPIIRRWYRKNIPNDGSLLGIVCYDYIKLSDELSQGNSHIRDYHVVGQKVDKLKRLAQELGCAIITSCQTNRQNEARSSAKDRVDDGNATGLSDQINQFASNVYLLNRLTIEELQDLKANYAVAPTHALIPLYTRRQGASATGFNDLVKISRGEDKPVWTTNKIYYTFDNFEVTENTDLKSLVKKYQNITLTPDRRDPEDEFLD